MNKTEDRIGKAAAIGALVVSVWDRWKSWHQKRSEDAAKARAERTAMDLKRIHDDANRPK